MGTGTRKRKRRLHKFVRSARRLPEPSQSRMPPARPAHFRILPLSRRGPDAGTPTHSRHQAITARPRGADSTRVFALVTLDNRGCRECRVRAAPAVSCAKLCEETHTSIQVQRRHSGIPCARENMGTKNPIKSMRCGCCVHVCVPIRWGYIRCAKFCDAWGSPPIGKR